MASQLLKTVAAAAAFAGAMASAGADELSLVQRDVRSVDNSEVGQGFASAFAAMMGTMQLEEAVKERLGHAGEDVSPSPSAVCSGQDRLSMVTKLSKLGKDKEKSPVQMVMSVLKELQDCKNVMFNGSPNPAHLAPCVGAFLGVSKGCSDCGTAYFKNMLSVPGCTKQCLPMMLKCGDWKEEFSAACMRTTSECMKCGHTYYREFSKCVAGSPSIDETMSAMDRIYDGMALGKTNIVDAISEAIGAALKRSNKVSARKAADEAKKRWDALDREEADLLKQEDYLEEVKAKLGPTNLEGQQ